MPRPKRPLSAAHAPLVPSEDRQTSGSDRSHRRDEDQERDKEVYRYLLTLTDLERDPKDNRPNETSIAKQWGLEKNRIFVRRVLRSVYSDLYADEKKETVPVPGLTLGKLVEILTALQTYRLEQRKHESLMPGQKIPRILTRSEKLRALRKFFSLSRDERKKLGLSAHPEEALIQKLLEDITDPIQGLGGWDIRRFYKDFQNRPMVEAVSTQSLLSEDDRRLFIQNYIGKLLHEQLDGLDEQFKSSKIMDLTQKVQREINRIEFQAGLQQIKLSRKQDLVENQQPNLTYLTSGFIQNLTRSIVENEILTDEFPIYLKYITAEKVKPLPLYIKTEEQNDGLLNSSLLDKDEREEEIKGLERQFAYRVQVHFFIKLPDGYEPELPDTNKMIKTAAGVKQLHFYEEMIGVGSLLSHIVAAINRALLWGIPALQDYLPIAQETWLREETPGGNSQDPVWSHTLVRLCRRDATNLAIQETTHHQPVGYEQAANDYEVTHGEFCGFDAIESSAKAAVCARLRAIKQAGVPASDYLNQLCCRVEELNAFKKARELLTFYPFSLKAMKGEFERTIFSKKRRNYYRAELNNFSFQEHHPGQAWTLVAYYAHIAIAGAYLKEGLYKIARNYLDVIKTHINNPVFATSSFMQARYHLCEAEYHYLTDLNDKDVTYPDRYKALRVAVEELEKAENILENRLAKYQKIQELPRTNFHPLFHLYSLIYTYRAKLYIYFSSYVEKPGDRWEVLLKPIRLLEKARIYAARDGNAACYSYWTAYQSWCYLMAGYLGPDQPFPPQGFSRSDCLDWATRLIEHMRICYSETGLRCYRGIKDNGGRDTAIKRRSKGTENCYHEYGNTMIRVVPLIQELAGIERKGQGYDPTQNVLTLDTSLLKEIGYDDAQSIYLFGTYSCALLFAIGMQKLCDDQPVDNWEKRLDETLRIFTYCWASAEDGAEIVGDTANSASAEPDKIYVDRMFEPASIRVDKYGDSRIRGLYPHRLTEFVGLGRIFAATCKLLLIAQSTLFSDSKPNGSIQGKSSQWLEEWEGIDELLDNLGHGDFFCTNSQAAVLNQERYNGHLEEHYKRIRAFFREFKQGLSSKRLHFSNFKDCRDAVVTRIFYCIRDEEPPSL